MFAVRVAIYSSLMFFAGGAVACGGSTIGEGIERPDPTPCTSPCGPGTTQQATKPKLTVRVVGLRNDKGVVRIAVYDDPDAYPMEKDKVLTAQKADIPDGADEVEVVFDDLEPGTYAIAMLHDENESGDMDKNIIGIPQEGYGASRNPGAGLSAPDWEDTHFELDGPVTLSIEVIY